MFVNPTCSFKDPVKNSQTDQETKIVCVLKDEFCLCDLLGLQADSNKKNGQTDCNHKSHDWVYVFVLCLRFEHDSSECRVESESPSVYCKLQLVWVNTHRP